jgi:hypothetical protein
MWFAPFSICYVSEMTFIVSTYICLFRFVVLPSPTYLLAVGVEVVYFHLITLIHTTVGRTPLDEGSAHRRGLYLTTQTLYKR